MEPDSAEIGFHGAIFDVVRETWDGRARDVVVHRGSVAVVAIDGEDRVVLVRQLREAARAELVELPAGTREPGEDPLLCARRELAEETGLRGGHWRELASAWSSPGFVRERMTIFVAEGLVEGEPALEEDESLELVRWPVGELAQRIHELEDLKTLAGLLLLLGERAAPR